MGAKSSIEWTDSTWNPVTGCTLISAGCAHCYAKKLHDQRHTAWLNGWAAAPEQYHTPFETVQVQPDRLRLPLSWKAPRTIFVNSMSDLFHEDVPFDFIAKVFAVMAMAPEHTFQILTKRPERMAAWFEWIKTQWARMFPGGKHHAFGKFEEHGDANVVLQFISDDEAGRQVSCEREAPEWPLKNVWLSTSVENQKTADERIPHLLKTPAAVRFLSIEPLLNAVNLDQYLFDPTGEFRTHKGVRQVGMIAKPTQLLHWVIVGGESGAGARPMHPDWARSIRDQCVNTGVPFFFKQWGEWFPRDQWEGNPELCLMDDEFLTATKEDADFKRWGDGHFSHRVGKAKAGRLLDGREWNEFPKCYEAAVL